MIQMDDTKKRLNDWLALLDGPGWKGPEAQKPCDSGDAQPLGHTALFRS